MYLVVLARRAIFLMVFWWHSLKRIIDLSFLKMGIEIKCNSVPPMLSLVMSMKHKICKKILPYVQVVSILAIWLLRKKFFFFSGPLSHACRQWHDHNTVNKLILFRLLSYFRLLFRPAPMAWNISGTMSLWREHRVTISVSFAKDVNIMTLVPRNQSLSWWYRRPGDEGRFIYNIDNWPWFVVNWSDMELAYDRPLDGALHSPSFLRESWQTPFFLCRECQ
jgi:hypothetical protein